MDHGRASVFDRNGRFARTIRSGPYTAIAYVEDGSLLALAFARGTNQYATGHVRDTMALLRLMSHSNQMDTIARIPGDELYRIRMPQGIFAFEAPLARSQSLAVAGPRIYVSNGNAFQLDVLSIAGERLQLLRRPDSRRTLSSNEMAAHTEQWLARISNEARRAELRQMLIRVRALVRQP